jgi:hypothetical protein
MLVVYPANGYNTFLDLPEADAIASTLLGADKWTALSDDERKRYLIAAFNYIISLDGIVLPDAPEECINSTQVKIAVNEVVSPTFTNIMVGGSAQSIKSAKVGPVSVTYADTITYTDIPQDIRYCLEGYGANFASAGFAVIDLLRA